MLYPYQAHPASFSKRSPFRNLNTITMFHSSQYIYNLFILRGFWCLTHTLQQQQESIEIFTVCTTILAR